MCDRIGIRKTDDEYRFIITLLDFEGEMPRVKSKITHKYFKYPEEQEKPNDDNGMD